MIFSAVLDCKYDVLPVEIGAMYAVLTVCCCSLAFMLNILQMAFMYCFLLVKYMVAWSYEIVPLSLICGSVCFIYEVNIQFVKI